MGGHNNNLPDSRNFVDYSQPNKFMPVAADRNIPEAKFNSQGDMILTPEEQKFDEAAGKVEKAGMLKPIAKPTPTPKNGLTSMSPNSYGRDASKPLSSEQAIDIGLA